jgi:cell division transport system permease protein
VSATPVKVFLTEPIDSAALANWREAIAQRPYVSSQRFVSKEEALERMRERTGENILAVTEGINPLPAAVEITLDDEWLNQEKVKTVMGELRNDPPVADAEYPVELLADANRNVPAILLGAVMLCVVVCMIVVYLIFGAIRGAIYAQRLNIRTMQLIGATKNFIRRPFVFRGLAQGFMAGIIAGALLLLFLSGLRIVLSDVITVPVEVLLPGLVVILGGIVLLGSLLGFTGSGIAVNRFLDQDLTDLMK